MCVLSLIRSFPNLKYFDTNVCSALTLIFFLIRCYFLYFFGISMIWELTLCYIFSCFQSRWYIVILKNNLNSNIYRTRHLITSSKLSKKILYEECLRWSKSLLANSQVLERMLIDRHILDRELLNTILEIFIEMSIFFVCIT